VRFLEGKLQEMRGYLESTKPLLDPNLELNQLIERHHVLREIKQVDVNAKDETDASDEEIRTLRSPRVP
jgi:hypothetical protein